MEIETPQIQGDDMVVDEQDYVAAALIANVVVGGIVGLTAPPYGGKINIAAIAAPSIIVFGMLSAFISVNETIDGKGIRPGIGFALFFAFFNAALSSAAVLPFLLVQWLRIRVGRHAKNDAEPEDHF